MNMGTPNTSQRAPRTTTPVEGSGGNNGGNAALANAEQPSLVIPSSPAELLKNLESARGDTSSLTELKTQFFFWSPLYEERDAAKKVTRQEYVPVRGLVLARRPRPEREGQFEGGATHYYIFCLIAPTVVKTVEGDWAVGKPGDMVWVDERANLSVLSMHLPKTQRQSNGEIVPTAVTDVCITPISLDAYVDKKTQEPRQAWKFGIALKRLDAMRMDRALLTPPATPVGEGKPGEGDKDIPF